MDRASAFDTDEITADSSVACSGLRKRMEGNGCSVPELKADGASATPFCNEDVSVAASGSATPTDEQPDLTGERGCYVLLIVLYALQGSLLGLASGTLPFIIQVH